MADRLALCYHGVSTSWPASIAVPPDALSDQLTLLLRRGYRPVTLRELVLDPPRTRAFAVTFDDGYRSVLELARPLLAEHGIPGSLYVPTDQIDASQPMRWPGIEQWLEGPHASELLPLSWTQLRELAAAGWEIGSHTCTHPHLTKLDDPTLGRELADSRARLEDELDRPCDTIAYPYGDLDQRVAAAAARCGYRVGAAIGSVRPMAPLDFARVGVYRRDVSWRFRAKVSPAVRRLRTRGQPYARA